eukprot:TRINITY_DN28151_c0_g1_i1.p1 TRINITY_DN28151_c0_g1~~TRINITY_DN28151_c0_g1_i1.p1  ORF type:complete len:226 (+),score=13.61 TRINITY_DN28151_c0_g1_i1:504-1181(+)
MTFSELPSVTTQDLLISLPTYKRLHGKIQNAGDIPMERLLFQMKGGVDGYNEKFQSEAIEKINQFILKNNQDAEIWDYRSHEKSINKSQDIINIIFTVVIIIVMFLCFFSLTSSMSANIIEQSKEIAILRALGVTKPSMVVLYIYEAFVLVFSSSFMGLVIGTVVGFTMTMQRALFTQLPIKFTFPLLSFFEILFISILVAILSSLMPAISIMRKSITEIVRMTN